MSVRIQLRRDTAANWASSNPILAQGEIGVELVTRKFKIGDGTTAWNSLLYASSSGATGAGFNQWALEHDNTITDSYTVSAGKNVISAGAITINNGVTVTVPSGSAWVIV